MNRFPKVPAISITKINKMFSIFAAFGNLITSWALAAFGNPFMIIPPLQFKQADPIEKSHPSCTHLSAISLVITAQAPCDKIS